MLAIVLAVVPRTNKVKSYEGSVWLLSAVLRKNLESQLKLQIKGKAVTSSSYKDVDDLAALFKCGAGLSVQ